MRKYAIRSVAGLAVLATLGLACSSDDEGDSADTTDAVEETDAPDDTQAPATDAPADTAAAGGSEFTIEGFAFQQGFVATAGEAFTVVNADGTTHTVSGPGFSVRVDGGASESLTVDAPGEYAIFCEIHPSMTGTITVG